jgi:hypothetical protein
LPTQEHQVAFGVMEISGDQFQYFPCRGNILLTVAEYARAPCDPNRRIDDGFGCVSMSIASLDTENVAGQVKGPNLTTAIGKKLKRADRARCDLVDIVRRFIFSENFSTPAVFEIAPKAFLSDWAGEITVF